MKSNAVQILVFVAVFASGLCSSCTNPEVTSNTFTTLDATILTNIAYVSEFDVRCTAGSISNLYADIEGSLAPVASIGLNKYQVSWTEDIKTARSGDRVIRLFDEDGFTAVRKALRAGEDISAIPALFNVVVNHPGAFTGPWLKSEFLAVALSVVIAYAAITSRSKLVS